MSQWIHKVQHEGCGMMLPARFELPAGEAKDGWTLGKTGRWAPVAGPW